MARYTRYHTAMGLAVGLIVWSGGLAGPGNPARADTFIAQPLAKGDTELMEAYRQGQSDVMVEGVGWVTRLLADDLEGSRHQRFILQLASGQTLLVSHNIDVAPRINSLRVGDEVRFRGEYEWNDRGGIVHWTHNDPKGWHPDGWLIHNQVRYE